jgi:hypothetical protein
VPIVITSIALKGEGESTGTAHIIEKKEFISTTTKTKVKRQKAIFLTME